MLADNQGHFRVAEVYKQTRPRFGMIFERPEAPRLGDIMKECRSLDQLPVDPGEAQMVGQKQGNPADLP